MLILKNFLKEKNIHRVFEIALISKAIHAFIEILSSIFLYFVNQDFVSNLVLLITHEELSEDPKDFIAHYLIKSAEGLSITSQHFAAFYLLSHGIIKIVLITELLRKRLWAYPASIVIFSLFIIYQLYRFTFTHSLWLIFFTVLDALIIWLTVHEYRYMKHSLKSQV
jgi:uncharacterized membrane protein